MESNKEMERLNKLNFKLTLQLADEYNEQRKKYELEEFSQKENQMFRAFVLSKIATTMIVGESTAQIIKNGPNKMINLQTLFKE